MAIGFGLIGCGMIAKFHAKAIADLRGAKVVGCFDTFPASADRLAGEIGCTAYHDLDKMLANPDIQIVTICTPSGAPTMAKTKLAMGREKRRCTSIIIGVVSAWAAA